MVSCEGSLVKYLLAFFNLGCLIIGCIIIYFGFEVFQWNSEFKDARELAEVNLLTSFGLVIVFGIFVVVIALLGFVGAYFEKPYLLYAYASLLLVVIGVEIYIVYDADRNHESVSKSLGKGISKIAHDFFDSKSNSTLPAQLERIQHKYNCCGWNGPQDYSNQEVLPSSCCKNDPFKSDHYERLNCVNPKDKYETGCGKVLKIGELMKYFKGTFIVVLTIILFELILVFAACCLLRDMRSGYWRGGEGSLSSYQSSTPTPIRGRKKRRR